MSRPMKRGRPRTGNNAVRAMRAIAKIYLIEHPYATITEVAQATKVSARTVSLARKELRDAGSLKRSHGDFTSPLNPATDQIDDATTPSAPSADQEILETKSAGDLIREVEHAAGTSFDDLPPDKMKRILSRIANNPAMPPQVRIMAITAKNKLDFETQDRHDLGPGVPLSRESAVERLSWLMEACGPSVVEDAISLAFSPKGLSNGQTVETADPIELGETATNSVAASTNTITIPTVE